MSLTAFATFKHGVDQDQTGQKYCQIIDEHCLKFRPKMLSDFRDLVFQVD